MTAVIGVLNKRAVAIAADSASTSHNGKIINHANKIFTLSKYHPVGIMLHNVDSFMGTPWETIIKLYRHQLGTANFNTLKEYQEDFIKFLKVKDFFCDNNMQSYFLNLFCLDVNNLFIRTIDKIVPKDDPDRVDKFLSQLNIHARNRATQYADLEKLPDFLVYTYDEFSTYIENRLQEIIDHSFTNDGFIIDVSTRELLKRAYFNELVCKEFGRNEFTGVVFTGFGEEEIFPSLIPLRIFFGFENKLRYHVHTERQEIITHTNSSGIATFAQSDVMLTILKGIAPDLQQTYDLNFSKFLKNYDQIILDNYTSDKTELQTLLSGIDKAKIVTDLTNLMNDAIQEKYITPLFDTITGLSKEDLGEMAESLIYLTYLQRRITNAQESVGGPVDVAILTKGDGFIWIKRKHYFKPELNPGFFKNYF